MLALFTEDQTLIAETGARIAVGGRARARAVMRGLPSSGDPTPELMRDWSGLGVDETANGIGGSLIDGALLLEALGRQVDPTPFVPHYVAIQAAFAGGLPVSGLLERGVRLALVTGEAGSSSGAGPGVPGCDMLVWLTPSESLLVHPAETATVSGIDPTRSWGAATFGSVIAQGERRDLARARATALIAAELCGIGQGAIDLAAAYACERYQFGKPIGSYQAIGHRLAQAKSDVEAAWSLTLHACWAADHAPHDLIEAASAAKALAGDAAVTAAESCVQTFGGMGITLEADPHLYLKRALASDSWLGSSYEQRRSLARAVLAA